MKCETCPAEATNHIKHIDMHFCSMCLATADQLIARLIADRYGKLNTMNPVIIAYVPPPGIGHPEAFISNLAESRPLSLPVLLFQDVARELPFPTHQLNMSPEAASEGGPKWPAVSNAAFLCAAKLAAKKGYTHMIYLEEDCRVVPGWDAKLWEAYCDLNNPKMIAGSLVVYHAHQLPPKAKAWARALLDRNYDKNIPVPSYGTPESKPPHRAAVFPNGALAVYPVETILAMFDLGVQPVLRVAKAISAYDHEIGWKLVETWGDSLQYRVAHLPCVLSTYKEQVLSAERLQSMLGREVVGIHPVKTDWTPTHYTPKTTAVTETAASLGEQRHQDDEAGRGSGTYGKEPGYSMSIFIVTYKPDFGWLYHCLRSIGRFCRGFHEVVVAVPNRDMEALEKIRKRLNEDGAWPSNLNLLFHGYQETQGKGHLDHNFRKCSADKFCGPVDLIAHVDADCVFREPTTPEAFMQGGKPVLLIEPYEHLRTAHPGRFHWKAGVDRALGIDAKFETMCRHPAVHWRGLYGAMRQRVEENHGVSFYDYVMSCQSERPCGFAEFPTLGAYAVASKSYGKNYRFIDVTKEDRPHEHLIQFWSRQSPELPQDIWIEGKLQKVVPAELIKEIMP